MPEPTLTLAQLAKLDPCRDRLVVMQEILPKRRRITAAQAREAGATFRDLVWVASAMARKDRDVERRLRMWMADCAARVLRLFEQKAVDDARPRQAIEAARAYARGEIDAAAGAAAWAAGDAAWAAGDAAWAAGTAAWAAGDAAWAAARAAARAAAGEAAAWDAAFDAEKSWQFDRLILWLSADEPEPVALPDIKETSDA